MDGKKVYGAYIYTERGSEGITMGVTNALYDWGFQYDEPEEALSHGRLRQFAGSRQGMEFTRRCTSAARRPA